jgi:hypothetical protein
VVDEFFAGAQEAVDLLFEGEQGWVADEDGGVGLCEHGVEVSGRGKEWDRRIAPLVKEDAGVGERGAAGGVGGDAAQGGKRLSGAADQQQGADPAFGSDGAAGQDFETGCGGEGCDGDEAYIGGSGGKVGSALGGGHAVSLIAEGEWGGEWRVLEVPHEGRGVEEVDGGYAQAGMGSWVHALLRLASGC